MGSTEARSRDEWLAEAKRRGRRLRRRRRLALGTLGALALVVPASALASFTPGGPEPGVEMSVAGPAPVGTGAGGGPTTATTATAAAGSAEPGAGEPGPAATTTAAASLRVEAGHGRTAPPEPSTTLPAGDDPVHLRPGATNPAPTDPNASVSSPVLPAPGTTAAAVEPALAPCPADTVGVAVSTARDVYTAGEKVEGFSILENRGPAACLLPTRAFFRVLNSAGDDVGGFAHTMEFRIPVRADPGGTFTSSFTWDQQDCTGPVCAQVPAGTYTLEADWSESGPYAGRSSFQVGP